MGGGGGGAQRLRCASPQAAPTAPASKATKYERGGGALKGRGEGGVWLGPPSSQGPPMVPAEGRPKNKKLKLSGRQRRRSKTLAVSLKHWKGRRASKGQVWTRHLAPAAPASRPSLPTQFHDCACHSDSAMQFLSLPSALNGVRVGLLPQGSGLCRLFGLSLGRSVR